MYTYYCLKLYFANGQEGYYCIDGTVVANLNEASFYDTADEVRDLYDKIVRGHKCSLNGSPLVRCTVQSANSSRPL